MNAPRIQLSWQDPVTGKQKQPVLDVPIALGREFIAMPAEIDGRRVSRMVLEDSQVSRFHALIDWQDGGFIIEDQDSRNGILVNGTPQTQAVLSHGDILWIEPFEIKVKFL